MNTPKPVSGRVAVCSWSLQPASPEELALKLRAAGVRRVQLALDPLRQKPSVWGQTQQVFQHNEISIISGMFGCLREDYSTLESIRATGGLAPDATWPQNLKNIIETVALSEKLGLKLVTFHAGFLPHDKADPVFAKMLRRLGETADAFGAAGIDVALETGQETARDLARLLLELDRRNAGINFDPANMILYDKGNPVEAFRLLGPWVRQVHIKDALRTKTPGTWGQEVPAGSGEVDWPRFFQTLKGFNYSGPFVIEREAGAQRLADIVRARELIEKQLR